MKPSRRTLVYLGWQHHGNFGDDLLQETWRAALGDPLELEAPLTTRAYVRSARRFARDRLGLVGSERIVLLGGGTTVGFEAWAEHARLAVRAYGADGVLGVGLGAAARTDAFSIARHRQRWDAWQQVPGLRIAGVRGPVTVDEVTANLGPTAVCGDPALLYPLVRPVDPAPGDGRRRIGVSLGSDPCSRFDVDTVASAVDEHARAVHADEVVVLALSTPDRPVARALTERLRTPSVLHEYTSVPETMSVIAGCDLVVSERLHGTVAAVALGVATVPLSYASKCDDFWSSITGHPAPIAVGHTAEDLVHAMQDADRVRQESAGAVFVLQERLEGIRRAILDWKHGRRSAADLLGPTGVSA